jgi:hypothetical protein
MQGIGFSFVLRFYLGFEIRVEGVRCGVQGLGSRAQGVRLKVHTIARFRV